MRGTRSATLLVALLPAWTAAIAAQQVDEEAEPEIHGAAAAFSLVEEERERVWLPAGSALFESPDVASDRLATIDVPCEIEVLERNENWRKVHYGGRFGWVDPELPEYAASLNMFPQPEPVLVVTPGFEIANPTQRREVALQALGLSEPNGKLGPWDLMTDVEETRLIDYLDRIASGLIAAYRERFGLEPTEPAEQAVAVFSTEQGYRPFESEVSLLAGLGARGHAGNKLAALFVEDNRLEEASSLLVHELTHLMNRSALGPDPPPWIEEGIANDLAYSRVNRSGELRLGSINGERLAMGNRRLGYSFQYTGGVAALAELLRTRARHASTPLDGLVELDKAGFLADESRRRHYVESAFLVRFLLEAEKGRYADGFRRYLAAVGDGERPTADQFIAMLDTGWKRLERAFDAWLRIQSAQLLR